MTVPLRGRCSGKEDSVADGQYKAAIFDLDGTLVDSMWLWEDIDRRFFARHGVEYPEDYMQTVGPMGVQRMAQYTKDRFGLSLTTDEIIDEWRTMSADAYRTVIFCKPGAREYLEYLAARGIPMAIASVSPRSQVDAALDANGIRRFFSVIATVEEVERPKQFPDIYLFVAGKLGLSPAECLVFEDLPIAMRGAAAGGFACVAADDASSRAADAEKRALSVRFVRRLDELCGDPIL